MGHGALRAGVVLPVAALLLMVVVSCGTNDGIYRELQEANGLP